MRLGELSRARVGILGSGREGRAALSAIRQVNPGADVTVLAESGTTPGDAPARLGPFDDALLEFEVLVRSPGVPVLHPALQAFRAAGGTIVNPGSIWFSERPDVAVVGVTGSKGKSTTSSLLAHLLQSGGRKVLLAGNIGTPLLAHLETEADLVVAELSSYQLSDLEGRFRLGLITRLFPEHGDWHGGVAHYYASKLRLVELLAGSPLLINATDDILLRQTAKVPGRLLGNRPPLIHRRDDRLQSGEHVLTELDRLQLIGRHNLDNAALALEAAVRLGVGLETAVAALERFRPLEHRLESVLDRDGLAWINDSIATTPHATLAALQALSGQSVILIAGGFVRPADWLPVVEHCRDNPLKGLILMPDSGEEIGRRFVQAGVEALTGMAVASTLDQAVRQAVAMAGGAEATVLLSPGSASFPQYRDFEDRGARFREAVERYYSERSTA